MEIGQTKVKKDIKQDILVELVLYDVLDKIFSYLTIKDLCRAAAVCKSWQYIANMEISRRTYIETLIWPIMYDSDVDDFHEHDKNEDHAKFGYVTNRWHIRDSMRSLPKLVLLFNDKNETYHRNIEQFFVYHWSRVKIGTKIGAIHSLAVYMNYTELVTNSNLGVAITLPSTPKLKCAAYSPNDLELQIHAKNNTIPQFAGQAANILLSTEDSHNCFIIFKNERSEIKGDDLLYSRSFLTEFTSSLKQKCKPGTYSIWGGGVPLFITNVNSLGINSFVWFFIARISGSAFDSWSVVLKADLSDIEKEEKLINFKRKSHFKSNTVALAITSSNELFRKIFPEVSLISIYEKDEFVQLGINTIDCDSNPQVEHTKSVIYLVLTTE